MVTASLNGHPICVVAGCEARVHGAGLCRKHFDLRRYQETSGQSPEARARRAREWRIEGELSFGPRERESVFADDEERREAWEERKAEMLAEYTTRSIPGGRPWAFWELDAGRPDHLTEYPSFHEGTVDERADALDTYEIEPVAWLAEAGYLTDAEINLIAEQAEVARPRINTDDEHVGSDGVDRADRRAVNLHDAVELALRH